MVPCRYFPNYEEAEPLLWGHDMGRDFFVMACNQWPLAAKHYVCPMRDFAFEGQRFDITQVRAPREANQPSPASSPQKLGAD